MTIEAGAAGVAAPVIAALLTGEPIPAHDRAALYRRFGAMLLPVCGAGPWHALRDVARAARRDALSAATEPEVRHAAIELLDEVSRPAVVRALIEGARGLGSVSGDLGALLAAAGGTGIWEIARHLKSDPASPIAADLRTLATRQPPEVWRAVAVDAAHRPFAEVAALFPLIRALPAGLARDTGSTLVGHDDPRVHRAAIAFLLAVMPRDLAWNSLLDTTLRAGDAGESDIARAALVRFGVKHLRLVELALDPTLPTQAQGRLRTALEELRNTLLEGATPSGPVTIAQDEPVEEGGS